MKKSVPAPLTFRARTIPDLVDHLEGIPLKEVRDVVRALVDAKKPASAGGRDVTSEEWRVVVRELADLGVVVVLEFLDG